MNFAFGAPVQTRWPWFNLPGWVRWTVTLFFFGLVNWMLLAPSGVFRWVHLFFAHQDKLAHWGIFLVLSFLVRWSAPSRSEADTSASSLLAMTVDVEIVALTALVIYAAAVEVFQPLLTGLERLFEWLDMASNYAGLFTGWFLFGKVRVDVMDEVAVDSR